MPTNADIEKARATVHVDPQPQPVVQPTKKQEQSQREVAAIIARNNLVNARNEGAVLDDVGIVAKPLHLPGKKIVLRDSSLVPFFAFRGSGAKTTRRVSELLRKGFRLAIPTDLVDSTHLDVEDGHLTDGDLILMVCKKDLYYGYQKHNAQRSIDKVSPRNLAQAGAGEIRHSLANPNAAGRMTQAFTGVENVNTVSLEVPDSPGFGPAQPLTNADRDKVSIFIPGETDLPVLGKTMDPGQ